MEFRVPIPRCHGKRCMWPCGGVAIRNPLRIGPGATRKIHAAWAAWKSRRRRRRGARGHPHTDAQSFAHRSWATQDPTASPTCHSKWERYSEGTPPGDTQSSAHRSSGHARSPVVPPRSLPPACSRRAGGKRPSIIRSSTSEGACRTACHVAIRNPLRIGPRATRKILAAWAAWKSRDGARGHATYTDAQSFAHRSCATQDPTARRPAFQVGEVPLTLCATAGAAEDQRRKGTEYGLPKSSTTADRNHRSIAGLGGA